MPPLSWDRVKDKLQTALELSLKDLAAFLSEIGRRTPNCGRNLNRSSRPMSEPVKIFSNQVLCNRSQQQFPIPTTS